MAVFRDVLSRLGVSRRRAVVPVVRLSGVIAEGGALGRRGLSLAGLAQTLDRAFAVRGARAVALAINSPGGSPVQSALIGARVRALAAEKNLPVLAFVEDVAASGGYWLACAADEIHADPSSVVGSIGVISAGFGFPDLLKRIGVERRVHTAGDSKSMLDPFQPEKPEDVVRLRALQDDIHGAFRDWVRTRRGARLRPDALDGGESRLFSGEFWTARRALEFGLVDGLGDLHSVLRARFGDTVRTPVMAPRRGWIGSRFGLAPPGPRDAPVLGAAGPAFAALADDLLAAAEERFLWGRFGL